MIAIIITTTSIPDGIDHQVAHGEDDAGSTGTVQSATQRQEEPIALAPPQVVPQPAGGTKAGDWQIGWLS